VYFSLPTAPALDEKGLDAFNQGGSRAVPFQTATNDTLKRFEVAQSKISTKQQLTDAFAALQSAENVRDKSPEAYQDARIRYYTLLKGEDWMKEEEARIVNSEVAPKVASYVSSYQDMTRRQEQQQRTMDVVKAVKDKVISMKDDFKMTTNVFGKQIAELKSQIEIEKRRSLDEKQEVQSWFDFVVNILVVVFAIAAILAIVRKLVSTPATPAPPTIGIS
jgi:hypothetical protein